MAESKSMSMNTMDWKKIGMGALVAVVWVLLTYVTDLIPTIDFWPYTPIVVAGFSVLANIVRKWMSWKK